MRQCSLMLEEDLALHLHACQDGRICLWLDDKPGGVDGGAVLDREQALGLSLALVDWVEWLDAPEGDGEGPWT